MKKKEIMVLEDLLGSNKKIANDIREKLTQKGILTLNLMSSPGAGKTTFLEKLAEFLAPDYKMAVIEGDVDSPLGPRVQKPFPYGILPDHPNPVILLDPGGDGPPALAVVLRQEGMVETGDYAVRLRFFRGGVRVQVYRRGDYDVLLCLAEVEGDVHRAYRILLDYLLNMRFVSDIIQKELDQRRPLYFPTSPDILK